MIDENHPIVEHFQKEVEEEASYWVTFLSDIVKYKPERIKSVVKSIFQDGYKLGKEHALLALEIAVYEEEQSNA